MEFSVKIIKTKNGSTCPVLCAELGYRSAYVTFDVALISEISGIDIKTLRSLGEGETIPIK